MWHQIVIVLVPKIVSTVYDKVFTNDKTKETHMNETKKWYASKGVWGSIAAVVGGVAGMFGVDFSTELQSQFADVAVALVASIGGVVAFIGRVKADKVIK